MTSLPDGTNVTEKAVEGWNVSSISDISPKGPVPEGFNTALELTTLTASVNKSSLSSGGSMTVSGKIKVGGNQFPGKSADIVLEKGGEEVKRVTTKSGDGGDYSKEVTVNTSGSIDIYTENADKPEKTITEGFNS